MKVVIVGAGPCGLALAQMLSDDHDVLVLEKNSFIGGIHGVDRQHCGMFSEHGPRVYSTAFVNFETLVKEWGGDCGFDSLFKPYKHPISDIFKKSISNFTIKEILVLLKSGFVFIRSKATAFKDVSVDEHCKSFSKIAIATLDAICRLADGAGSDRMSMNTLFQMINQNSRNQMIQPRFPNDDPRGFVTKWYEFLNKKNVGFLLDTKVEHFTDSSLTTSNGDEITFDKLILATPPQYFIHLFDKATVDEMNYVTYLPVTLHWKQRYDLANLPYIIPTEGLGSVCIPLSEYFETGDGTGTLVSATTTRDTINLVDNEDDLVATIWDELDLDLPNPDVAIVFSAVEKTNESQSWRNNDHAVIVGVASNPSLPFRVDGYQNVYTVGCHNARSNYSFTSIESAVQNAFVFMGRQLKVAKSIV